MHNNPLDLAAMADHFWLRMMRITSFALGAVFLVFALIEALWNPFEHTSEKFLAATGVALIFLGISRKQPEERAEEESKS